MRGTGERRLTAPILGTPLTHLGGVRSSVDGLRNTNATLLGMNLERAVGLLKERRDEAQRYLTSTMTERDFSSWRAKTEDTLRFVCGENSRHIERFRAIHWFPVAVYAGDPRPFVIAVEEGLKTAVGLLDAAIYEREQLASQDGPASPSGDTLDPELWTHVAHLVEGGHWGQVASQAAIFVESKVRGWARLSASDFGKDLMVKAFKPDVGPLVLGHTPGEQQGWQLFAQGFAQALSNVVRHRLEDRDDARRYASGVLGASSLLVNELRRQHPEAVIVAEPVPVPDVLTCPRCGDHLVNMEPVEEGSRPWAVCEHCGWNG